MSFEEPVGETPYNRDREREYKKPEDPNVAGGRVGPAEKYSRSAADGAKLLRQPLRYMSKKDEVTKQDVKDEAGRTVLTPYFTYNGFLVTDNYAVIPVNKESERQQIEDMTKLVQMMRWTPVKLVGPPDVVKKMAKAFASMDPPIHCIDSMGQALNEVDPNLAKAHYRALAEKEQNTPGAQRPHPSDRVTVEAPPPPIRPNKGPGSPTVVDSEYPKLALAGPVRPKQLSARGDR